MLQINQSTIQYQSININFRQ